MAPTTRGWIVVLSAFAIDLLLGATFVWSATPAGVPNLAVGSLTWSLCLTALGFAIVMPFAGAFHDHFGPRSGATLGAVLVGFGLLTGVEVPVAQPLSAWPPITALGFGLITGAGVALCYAATTPCAMKWFAPRHRGLVAGIVVCGFSIPWLLGATSLDGHVGRLGSPGARIAITLAVFGTLAGLAQMLATPPAGLVPPYSYGDATHAEEPIVAPPSYGWAEAARMPAFAALWVALAVGTGAAIGALLVLVRPTAFTGSALVTATTPARLIAATLGSIVGRPLAGLAFDLFGRRRTLSAALALMALALFFFAAWGASVGFAAALALGFGYGGLLAVSPALAFEEFGSVHSGADYGVLFTGWGVGAVLAVLVDGALAASGAQGYAAAFVAGGVACVFVAGLVWWVGPTILTRAPGSRPADSPVRV